MVTGVCTAPYIKYERDYADYTPQKIQDTKVIQISDPLGFSEAIKSPKLTIVNFYQSSFNPCKYFNPKFAKLAADMSQYARFVQVNGFEPPVTFHLSDFLDHPVIFDHMTNNDQPFLFFSG